MLTCFYRLDGWIVCKEHKKILLAAWKEDQIIQQQREAEVSTSTLHISNFGRVKSVVAYA